MSDFESADIYTDAFALDLSNEAASRLLAEDIAIILRTGDMVALSGDLGAGKTTLARAMLRYLADDDELEVPSPTYTLVQSYETRPKATHFDLYRIAMEEELTELGFEEAAETGIVLVEWPERSRLVEQETNISLHLDTIPAGGRRLVVRAAAESARRLSRSMAIRRFLETTGHGAARRRPFPADASARRYERIATPDGVALVLMDSPRLQRGPVVRDGQTYAEIAHIAQDVLPFVAIGEMLHDAGFSVPQIHSADLEDGFVLLEDLGSGRIVDAEGRPIPDRYEAAAQCLATLHSKEIVADLQTREGPAFRIPDFDRAAMAIEIDLLPTWFLPCLTGRAASEGEREIFEAVWGRLFDAIEGSEKRLVLRDLHSPNILWQEDREACRRLGLLDFQDAMIGPGAYDLASLAQDARADVSPELEARIVSAYRAARADEPGFDAFAFEECYAVMAAQRATKILGIFVRLAERDGKPQYLRHIPRLQAYLKRTLDHPTLDGLKALYEDWNILDANLDHGQR